MKILCICDHGQVRSVAMAYVLQEKGYDAIAISERTYLEDTGDYLKNWSDKIVDMTELYHSSGPHKDPHHLEAWIGRDEWGSPINTELLLLCKLKAEELRL